MNLIEELTQEVEAAENAKLDLPEIKTELFTKRLNLIDSALLASIPNELDPSTQAHKMTKLICKVVVTKDGKPAFPGAYKELASKGDPVLLSKIFGEIQKKGLASDRAEELSGKSEDSEE